SAGARTGPPTRTHGGPGGALAASAEFGPAGYGLPAGFPACSFTSIGKAARVPPEVPHPLRWYGAVPRHLGEQDGDGAGGGGDVRRGCGAPDPAVAPRHIPRVDGRDVHRAAEAPALALQEQLADLALALGGVVAGHQPHRTGGQQPAAVG